MIMKMQSCNTGVSIMACAIVILCGLVSCKNPKAVRKVIGVATDVAVEAYQHKDEIEDFIGDDDSEGQNKVATSIDNDLSEIELDPEPEYESNYYDCTACGGDGAVDGYGPCQGCGGIGVDYNGFGCGYCGGTGVFMYTNAYVCSKCGGSGREYY